MIDRGKFATLMAFIAAGVQKPITDAGLNVYYECLGDLSEEALAIAARRAVKEHKFATFPPVALLLELATASAEVGAYEAWKLAYRASCSIDPSNNSTYWADGQLWDSQTAFRMARLPPLVAEAVNRFGGLKLLADSDGEFARKQFMEAYAEVVSSTRRERTLADKSESKAIKGVVAAIGTEKP